MISKIAEELKHIAVPVGDLFEDPENVRLHDDRSYVAVAESFDEFGQRKPIIALENGRVIAGNAGLVAARDHLGWTHIAVVRFPDDEEDKAVRYAIADNRTAELSWFDETLLKDAVKKLSGIDPEATRGLGFSAEELKGMAEGLQVDLRPFANLAIGSMAAVPIQGAPTGPIPTVELVLISELKTHPRNYREHPDDQVEHIIQSLMEYGFYRNVVISKDSTILAGHGVVKASKKMELARVPCVRLDIDPDSARALKILAGDNESSHSSERDDRGLSEILKDVHNAEEGGLSGTGYDEKQLANLVVVTRHEDEIEDVNEAAEWVGMPEFEEGKKPLQLIISFESEENRKLFVEKAELKTQIAGKMLQAWWPDRGLRDLNALLVDDSDEASAE